MLSRLTPTFGISFQFWRVLIFGFCAPASWAISELIAAVYGFIISTLNDCFGYWNKKVKHAHIHREAAIRGANVVKLLHWFRTCGARTAVTSIQRRARSPITREAIRTVATLSAFDGVVAFNVPVWRHHLHRTIKCKSKQHENDKRIFLPFCVSHAPRAQTQSQ